jgi:hypothetical protein
VDFIQDWCANHYLLPSEREADEMAEEYVREIMGNAVSSMTALLMADRMKYGIPEPD